MSGQRFVPATALRPRGPWRRPRRLADLTRGPMGLVRVTAMVARRRPHPHDLPPTATGTRKAVAS